MRPHEAISKPLFLLCNKVGFITYRQSVVKLFVSQTNGVAVIIITKYRIPFLDTG